MAKTKVQFSGLLSFIHDVRSYLDVRNAVQKSGAADVARLLQHVDKAADLKGIDTEKAKQGLVDSA